MLDQIVHMQQTNQVHQINSQGNVQAEKKRGMTPNRMPPSGKIPLQAPTNLVQQLNTSQAQHNGQKQVFGSKISRQSNQQNNQNKPTSTKTNNNQQIKGIMAAALASVKSNPNIQKQLDQQSLNINPQTLPTSQQMLATLQGTGIAGPQANKQENRSFLNQNNYQIIDSGQNFNQIPYQISSQSGKGSQYNPQSRVQAHQNNEINIKNFEDLDEGKSLKIKNATQKNITEQLNQKRLSGGIQNSTQNKKINFPIQTSGIYDQEQIGINQENFQSIQNINDIFYPSQINGLRQDGEFGGSSEYIHTDEEDNEHINNIESECINKFDENQKIQKKHNDQTKSMKIQRRKNNMKSEERKVVSQQDFQDYQNIFQNQKGFIDQTSGIKNEKKSKGNKKQINESGQTIENQKKQKQGKNKIDQGEHASNQNTMNKDKGFKMFDAIDQQHTSQKRNAKSPEGRSRGTSVHNFAQIQNNHFQNIPTQKQYLSVERQQSSQSNTNQQEFFKVQNKAQLGQKITFSAQNTNKQNLQIAQQKEQKQKGNQNNKGVVFNSQNQPIQNLIYNDSQIQKQLLNQLSKKQQDFMSQNYIKDISSQKYVDYNSEIFQDKNMIDTNESKAKNEMMTQNDTLNDLLVQIIKLEKSQNKITQRIDIFEDEIIQRVREIQKFSKGLNQLIRKNVLVKCDDLQQKISNIENSNAFISNKENIIQGNNQNEEIQQINSKFQDLDDQVQQLFNEFDPQNQLIKQMQDEFNSKSQQLDNAYDNINKVNQELDQLKKQKNIEEKNIQYQQSQIQEQVDQIQNKLAEQNQLIGILDDQLSSQEERIESIQKNQNDIKNDFVQSSSVKNFQIEDNSVNSKIAEKVELIENNINNILKKINYQSIQDQIDKIQQVLQKNQEDAEQRDGLILTQNEDITNLFKSNEQVLENQRIFKEQVDTLGKNMIELAQQMEEQQTQIEQKGNDDQIINQVQNMLNENQKNQSDNINKQILQKQLQEQEEKLTKKIEILKQNFDSRLQLSIESVKQDLIQKSEQNQQILNEEFYTIQQNMDGYSKILEKVQNDLQLQIDSSQDIELQFQAQLDNHFVEQEQRIDFQMKKILNEKIMPLIQDQTNGQNNKNNQIQNFENSNLIEDLNQQIDQKFDKLNQDFQEQFDQNTEKEYQQIQEMFNNFNENIDEIKSEMMQFQDQINQINDQNNVQNNQNNHLENFDSTNIINECNQLIDKKIDLKNKDLQDKLDKAIQKVNKQTQEISNNFNDNLKEINQEIQYFDEKINQLNDQNSHQDSQQQEFNKIQNMIDQIEDKILNIKQFNEKELNNHQIQINDLFNKQINQNKDLTSYQNEIKLMQNLLKQNQNEIQILQNEVSEGLKVKQDQHQSDILTIKNIINIIQDSNFQAQIDQLNKNIEKEEKNKYFLPQLSSLNGALSQRQQEKNTEFIIENQVQETIKVDKNMIRLNKNPYALESTTKKQQALNNLKLDNFSGNKNNNNIYEQQLTVFKGQVEHGIAKTNLDISPIVQELVSSRAGKDTDRDHQLLFSVDNKIKQFQTSNQQSDQQMERINNKFQVKFQDTNDSFDELIEMQNQNNQNNLDVDVIKNKEGKGTNESYTQDDFDSVNSDLIKEVQNMSKQYKETIQMQNLQASEISINQIQLKTDFDHQDFKYQIADEIISQLAFDTMVDEQIEQIIFNVINRYQ